MNFILFIRAIISLLEIESKEFLNENPNFSFNFLINSQNWLILLIDNSTGETRILTSGSIINPNLVDELKEKLLMFDSELMNTFIRNYNCDLLK